MGADIYAENEKKSGKFYKFLCKILICLIREITIDNSSFVIYNYMANMIDNLMHLNYHTHNSPASMRDCLSVIYDKHRAAATLVFLNLSNTFL